MQDIQNIPNPDVDSFVNEDFGSHSDVHPDSESREESQDVEKPEKNIPVPPDTEMNAPVEEPPEEQNKPPVGDQNIEPERLV